MAQFWLCAASTYFSDGLGRNPDYVIIINSRSQIREWLAVGIALTQEASSESWDETHFDTLEAVLLTP